MMLLLLDVTLQILKCISRVRRGIESSWSVFPVSFRRCSFLHQYFCIIHINVLPIPNKSVSKGRSHGSRLHRPSASSYTSDVTEFLPPATMTHPPTAPCSHAKPKRPLCIGGSGSHRSPSTSRVSYVATNAVVGPQQYAVLRCGGEREVRRRADENKWLALLVLIPSFVFLFFGKMPKCCKNTAQSKE